MTAKTTLCLVVIGDRSMIATGGRFASVRTYVTSPTVSSERSEVVEVAMPSILSPRAAEVAETRPLVQL